MRGSDVPLSEAVTFFFGSRRSMWEVSPGDPPRYLGGAWATEHYAMACSSAADKAPLSARRYQRDDGAVGPVDLSNNM